MSCRGANELGLHLLSGFVKIGRGILRRVTLEWCKSLFIDTVKDGN